MRCRLALVAMFVVAGDTRHELLCVGALLCTNLLLEILGVIAAQRRCPPAAMQNLNVTVLSKSIGEPEIV
jgi:hypothetical protein